MLDKKRKIMDTSLKFFSELGYEATTIPIIAKNSNVAAGTIYNYFKNKESLINEVFQEKILELSNFIKKDYDDTKSIEEKFHYISDKLFFYGLKNKHVYRFFSIHDDGYYLTKETKNLLLEFNNFFISIIIAEQKDNKIKNLSFELLFSIVYGSIETFIIISNKYSKEELIFEFEKLKKCIWNAISI